MIPYMTRKQMIKTLNNFHKKPGFEYLLKQYGDNHERD